MCGVSGIKWLSSSFQLPWKWHLGIVAGRTSHFNRCSRTVIFLDHIQARSAVGKAFLRKSMAQRKSDLKWLTALIMNKLMNRFLGYRGKVMGYKTHHPSDSSAFAFTSDSYSSVECIGRLLYVWVIVTTEEMCCLDWSAQSPHWVYKWSPLLILEEKQFAAPCYQHKAEMTNGSCCSAAELIWGLEWCRWCTLHCFNPWKVPCLT